MADSIEASPVTSCASPFKIAEQEKVEDHQGDESAQHTTWGMDAFKTCFKVVPAVNVIVCAFPHTHTD